MIEMVVTMVVGRFSYWGLPGLFS
nr:hypothetical protein [Vibrio taketomensis]